jgi:hypothetical protein
MQSQSCAGTRLAILLAWMGGAVAAWGGPKLMIAGKTTPAAPVAAAPASGPSTYLPVGSEYALVGALPGNQSFPQLAVNGNGGYVVWQDNGVTTNGLRIRAARLDANFNPSGSPLVVSSAAASKATGDQQNPQVALLGNGGAVFVWAGGVAGSQQIYVRFISSAGKLLNSDVRVSAHSQYNQINPHVAVMADGSVVVVWSSFGQDGSLQGVFARHFSSTGSALRAEFQVNQFTLNNQRTPAVAALPNGNYVVAWVSELERASSSVDVYARLFTPVDTALTSEFPVNVTTNNPCANPSVAASPLGGFAVAWSQNDNVVSTRGSAFGIPTTPARSSLSTNGWDVFGRVFSSAGVPTTDPFRLNTYTYGDQYVPKLAALGADYMAVWTSLGQDGSFEGVFGQFFSNTGVFEGSELPINTTTVSHQFQPAVASDGSSRFLVTWSSFVITDLNLDLFAQVFQSAGQ